MKKDKEVLENEEEQVQNDATTEQKVNEERAEELPENDNDESDEETEDEEVSLEADLAESKDKYLRLYSEFENFRRRTAKERLELIGTASRDVMESLLPVMDDFERAIKAGETKKDNKGIELIYNKFKNVLESKGLKRMEIKTGAAFDDNFHEAITQIPAPKKKLEGKIVDVIEPGYFMAEKVIRFAKVVTGAKS